MREWLEKLEAYVLTIIEGRQTGKRHLPVRIFLYALSLVFAALVQTRLWLYRKSIYRPHTLGCQVISIGNLTVGGTGKTPVVEVFARTLQQSGRKVAILSRGYKRDEESRWKRLKRKLQGEEAPPLVVSDGERLLLDSVWSGDEPYMLASNLKDVVVIVDKDRVKAGRWAITKYGCDTLILDDGFQYLTLKHRLDIVLVDRTNPFGNWRMLPRGILREPVRNIKRAGFIFITKSNGDGAEDIKKILRQYNTEAEIVECRHCPRFLKNVYTDEVLPLDFLRDQSVAAISGIARPKGFEDELTRLGAKVLYHKRYADHHRYSQQEILDIINKGIQRGASCIITTEKDAVRFPMIERRDLPVYYLRVEIEMLSGEEKFHEWINRICFR
ncbi:MAG TPA: tetraacyldisaccharide 4'-kinase [Kiritimatiellia bacterium]|nr:tetraacyldisaccharide 4'-kinase [Kiritimatiellia bacterium]HMP34981.1 tetraacyldisaccharide 4'-kinase [Kiritimatiellia bacterium]